MLTERVTYDRLRTCRFDIGHFFAVRQYGRQHERVTISDNTDWYDEAQNQQVYVVGSVGRCSAHVVPRTGR